MQQTILIVDPDPVSMDQLCSFVSECDVRIQTATNLDMALRRIQETRFSIVIVDWQLPNSQASELVKRIRGNHRLRRTHVIALSEPADPDTIQRVLKDGVDDFFARPIASSEVRHRVIWAKSRALELV